MRADADELEVEVFYDFEEDDEDGGSSLYYCDYLSLVSDDTYGPPALVAPSKDNRLPRAQRGERVLYLNTRFVPMFAVTRIDRRT